MAFRKKLSKRSSRKIFRKTAKPHKKNLSATAGPIKRGGIRF